MYRTFEHGDKEYRLEFKVEAYMSKYVDYDGQRKTHVAPLVEYISMMNESGGDNVAAALDIPEIAAHAMFAGLMKYHGNGKHGDKTVTTFDDAKDLCMDIIDEHPDDQYLGSWQGLAMMCIEQLEEDGFFTKLAAAAPQDKKPKSKK